MCSESRIYVSFAKHGQINFEVSPLFYITGFVDDRNTVEARYLAAALLVESGDV